MIKFTGVQEIEDEEHNTRSQTYLTSTDNMKGTSNNQQQNVVVVDQPVPAGKNLHNDNQVENDMIEQEDEDANFRVDFDYVYGRRKKKLRTSSEVYKQSKLDKGKRQAQASSIFSQVTSRLKVIVHFKCSYQYLFVDVNHSRNIHLHAIKF